MRCANLGASSGVTPYCWAGPGGAGAAAGLGDGSARAQRTRRSRATNVPRRGYVGVVGWWQAAPASCGWWCVGGAWLGGGVLGALAALAATYGFGGRWGTALLSMGGTGLGAALLSYGAILYLRFFLIERPARALGPWLVGGGCAAAASRTASGQPAPPAWTVEQRSHGSSMPSHARRGARFLV